MSGQSDKASIGAKLFAAVQFPLPHHLLSRLVHWLTRRSLGPAHRGAIRAFTWAFKVDLGEAAQHDPGAYQSFNDFFTRALAPGARPLADPQYPLLSPVDGRISQLGKITNKRLYQAKGHDFSLAQLLGSQELARGFANGKFATIYLAPHNYHRIHMPARGRLVSMHFIPGRLFSVNAATVSNVPRLFARNERVACLFEGDHGPFAMVLVGALFVGSIETTWAGEITPGGGRQPANWDYPATDPGVIDLARGEEMGRFNMGSTVILLDSDVAGGWRADLGPGSALRMGEALSLPAQPNASQ